MSTEDVYRCEIEDVEYEGKSYCITGTIRNYVMGVDADGCPKIESCAALESLSEWVPRQVPENDLTGDWEPVTFIPTDMLKWIDEQILDKAQADREKADERRADGGR